MSVNDFNGRLSIRTDVNGPAWHNLGGFVGEKSALEAADEYKGGIPVFEKQATYIQQNGQYELTGDFALVRLPTLDDPKNRLVGYCTKNYHIVQPTDILKSFDENVKRPIETLWFLSRGERMFTTWEMPKSSFVVGKDDEVKLFGTVLAGFDAKVAISLSLLTFRVVCANTFAMAQAEVDNGKQSENGGQGSVWVG